MSLGQDFDSYRRWRDGVGDLIARLRDWLSACDLMDGQTEQRLARLTSRLAEDRLVVACVAEFSRGKSELINALFFADRGGRILPSSAGRTTMCPTELAWEKGKPASICLLPIETRGEGTSIADLRLVPEAWQTFPFDPDNTEAMAAALRRVGEVKQVPADAARALGFAVDDDSDGCLRAEEDGHVEIPRWRHALINIPHPLLEQGLVVLDTPGLNAIGAEPELTLSQLPSAHAVLFILAADTGVTQTDLTVWRDHVGAGPGRMVVLNKIDGLWDGLRSDGEINAEIDRQVDSCAHILGLPAHHVFPVSAQKGLVAKINDDHPLLDRSRLPRLEQALADELLPAKREIVARGTVDEAIALLGEFRQLLDTRHSTLDEQFLELDGLRGKNQGVVSYMMRKVKSEKETFERGLREYYAVRNVFSQLSDTLFSHLGLEAMRVHARRTREAMRQANFTSQLMGATGELFDAARQCLAQSEEDIAEIVKMMAAMSQRFGDDHGMKVAPPASLSLTSHREEIDRLEDSFRRQFNSFFKLMTQDKKTLTRQFFETVVAQMRKIFEAANRDAENWLRALMAPLEAQVKEVHRHLKHRLDNVRRIHEATDTLEERIEELTHARNTLNAQQNDLEELEAALESLRQTPKALKAAA